MPEIELPLQFYRIAWAGWVMYFFILESLAILDADPGETLSAQVAWIRDNVGSFAYFMIAALLLWMMWHFLVEENLFT